MRVRNCIAWCRRLMVWQGAIVLLATCAAAFGQAGPSTAGPSRPTMDCAPLGELTVPAYSILSATRFEASGGTASRCRVVGVLPPEIVFEVVLPDAWNGRILMTGNGGYAGTSPDARGRRQRSARIASSGFVSVYTNTGHDREAEPLGSFALNNRQKEIDYSFRAVRLTIQTAKELTTLYYGQPANYAYWQGCSTGGRQGLMAAQRFPKDFDGIVVGAPVLNFTDTQIWGAWNARALAETPLGLSKVESIAEAIYARCDELDGLKDGLLEDPRNCDFDPRRDLPQCEGESGGQCFSDAEVTVLEQIYGGVTSGGKPLFPGLPFGSEAKPPTGQRRTSGWNGWIIAEGRPSRQAVFAETFFRYMAF